MIKRGLSKVLTFKEILTNTADDFENSVDIAEELEKIKAKMQEFVYKRSYTISLIKVKQGPVAIGYNTVGCTSLFIPDGITPVAYMDLFIRALASLGFDDESVSVYEQDYTQYHSWDITLTW